MLKKILLAIVVFGISCSIAEAQETRDINKEVEVRTNYKPKINKAKRLGKLPEFKDTVSFKPDFDYFVQTTPIGIGFLPAEIPAAKIVGEPLAKLTSHSLTLAGGNYSTLLGDYRFNNQRSKTTNFGVHLRHYSVNGKLELEDDKKVKPDLVEQLAEIYGSTYLNEGKVSGSLFYNHTGFNYYGFPQAESFEDSFSGLFPYKEQKLKNFGLNAFYSSTFNDEEKLNFGLGLKYEHFSDDIDMKESDVLLVGNARIRRGDAFWSLTSEFDFFSIDGLIELSNSNSVSDRKTLVWNLKPQYLLQTGSLSLQLGLNTILATGDDSETKLYPDVKVDFEVIEGIMSLFAGLNGDLKMNRYKNIVKENQFIYSGLNVKPSNIKYKLFGGIRGSMSTNSSFSLSAEYSAIDDQYFFVKQNMFVTGVGFNGYRESNKFGVLYDDISTLRLGADVTIGWSDKLELYSAVWYNNYSMDKLEEAWHMPEFEMQVNAKYFFTEDLTFNAEVNIIGERSVLLLRNNLIQTESLDAVYDLNIGANYQINDNITAFGQVNNLFADKYYHWDGYPSQGLNFLLGIKINL